MRPGASPAPKCLAQLHSVPNSPQKQRCILTPTASFKVVCHPTTSAGTLASTRIETSPPNSSAVLPRYIKVPACHPCSASIPLSPPGVLNGLSASLEDAMDRAVKLQLRSINQELLPRLRVKRLGAGKYEIDGRKLSLRWGPRFAGRSESCDGNNHNYTNGPDLFVSEDEVAGKEGLADWVPLQAYLQQAASVVAALDGRVPGVPAVARIPQEKRLTFDSPGDGATEGAGARNDGSDVLQRCASMRKACEEARLRERAAEAYEHGLLPWCTALPVQSRALSSGVCSGPSSGIEMPTQAPPLPTRLRHISL